MSSYLQAEFVTSAHELAQLPPADRPEIAFAGRSNAGKSSAINTLANRNRLAYVSKTPGRTQLINFFNMPEGYLVDLPGYGYADVPEKLKRHWQHTLATYLQERSTLKGMVLIMDVRHPLTALDEQMLSWFAPRSLPVHVLLTKADKLGFGQVQATLKAVRRELEHFGADMTVQLFSSLKKTGAEEANARIRAILGDDGQKKSPG